MAKVGKYRYKFTVLDDDIEDDREVLPPPAFDEKEVYLFTSDWDAESPDYIAEDAAEYYHDNCDGYDAHWPLYFVIYSDAGDKCYGVFKVEAEHTINFSATEVEDVETQGN